MSQPFHKNPLVDAVKDATRPRAQEDLEATAEPDGQFPPPAPPVDEEAHQGATDWVAESDEGVGEI